MEEIKRHLQLFPSRIRVALEGFSRWDKVIEIRMRAGAPLSLTTLDGNLFLDEAGRETQSVKGALFCIKEELRQVLGAFCGGSVYRHFENLMQGFAVDSDGWRLGLAVEKGTAGSFLPETIASLNLRIPHSVPSSADPVLEKIREEGLFSLLVLSPPAGGKTTLLRALAEALGTGRGIPQAYRTVVIDHRRELFPKTPQGILDILRSYEKEDGIEMATRLFSPQVLICDEITGEREAQSLIGACRGGSFVFASAHAKSLAEARTIPYLNDLLQSSAFSHVLLLKDGFRASFEAMG